MLITQEIINQVHDMLQWDRVLLDVAYVLNVPKTCASLMRACQYLEDKHGKPTELVIIPWSVSEDLIEESIAIFHSRDWNFNSVEDQQEFERLQIFKSEYRTNLFEAGYVGILNKRIPVVASIHCRKDGIATVASVPSEVEEHNSIYIKWAQGCQD